MVLLQAADTIHQPTPLKVERTAEEQLPCREAVVGIRFTYFSTFDQISLVQDKGTLGTPLIKGTPTNFTKPHRQWSNPSKIAVAHLHLVNWGWL